MTTREDRQRRGRQFQGHYDVKRRIIGGYEAGYIDRLVCLHCHFVVHLNQYRNGFDKSGAGKFNRARGVMVGHLNITHRNEVNALLDLPEAERVKVILRQGEYVEQAVSA